MALGGTAFGLLGDNSPSYLSWPLFTLALVAVFAVLRGWILGRRQIDPRGFVAGFQVGFLVLLLILFAQTALPPDHNMFLSLIAFLGIGLFGLWLARWLDSDISARRLDQAGWPLLACAIIAIVLMAGMGIWTFLDHRGVLLILSPVFWLWELVVALVQFLISLLPQGKPVEPIELLVGPQMPAPKQVGPNMIDFFGDWVRPVGRFMFYLSMGAMAGAALFRSLLDLLRWLNRHRTTTPAITFERSQFGLMDDLRDLLGACVDLFRRLWHRILKLFGSPRHPLPRGERTVREIYAQIMRWAARHGSPRAPHQTPYDFLPVLQGLLPDAEGDLTHLTECYVTVRYGTARADPELIRAMKHSWSRIRSKRKRQL